MFIYINQQAIACLPGDTLAKIIQEYCHNHVLHASEVAVAQHDTLLPRSQWTTRTVHADEKFSLFSAVAGG